MAQEKHCLCPDARDEFLFQVPAFADGDLGDLTDARHNPNIRSAPAAALRRSVFLMHPQSLFPRMPFADRTAQIHPISLPSVKKQTLPNLSHILENPCFPQLWFPDIRLTLRMDPPETKTCRNVHAPGRIRPDGSDLTTLVARSAPRR